MSRIILLFFAILAGGVAAWLSVAVRPVAPGPQEQAPPAPQPIAVVDVLVATRDVPRGEAIVQEHMRWQPWPAAAVNQKFITRLLNPDAINLIAGSIVSERVVELEPIYLDKVGPRGAGAMASLLPSGMRAIAVRINAETTAGGFILPNDRVDVLHSTQTAAGAAGERRIATRTILRNVMVLAIDQVLRSEPEANAKPKPAVVGKTATLELTPRQAETIIAAEATGSLSLALRSVQDRGEAGKTEEPAAKAEEQAAKAEEPDEKAEETSAQTVRVFRGREIETYRIPAAGAGGPAGK